MERAACEGCGWTQPVDWAPGDLCVACGAVVRREVRCAWCAEWTPAGRFCRSCGCEIVAEGLYGAARMLKSAGVDRFSIAGRLGDLDPERVQNLARIYESQLVVVMRRIEEARLCETYLLQKTHSRRLEEALIPLLPMEKQALEALASGPAGPYKDRPELLPEIARNSPIEMARILAAIALLRRGCADRESLAAARVALEGEDQALAVEAALGLAHWSVRLVPRRLFPGYLLGEAGIDPRRLAEVARTVSGDSPLLPWAAAALARARFPDGELPAPESTASTEDRHELESLRAALRYGLTSRDPDLRFTCALALAEEEIVAGELEAEGVLKRATARTFLARHNSPAVRICLLEGSDEIRSDVLKNLWPPLPEQLVDPVLVAVEHGDADMRLRGLRLLQPTLTAEAVSRLVKVALREADFDLFRNLLRSEVLPDSRAVVRSIIDADLFQTLHGYLSDHVDFSDEAVTRLASGDDIDSLEALITIAGCQLDRDSLSGQKSEEQVSATSKAPAAGRFLVQTAFGSRPARVCLLAYNALPHGRYRRWSWMDSQGIGKLFHSPREFLETITRVLMDPELSQGAMCRAIVVELLDHWPELGPLFSDARPAVERLAAALAGLMKEGFIDDRSYIEGLVVAMAPHYPAEALPAIMALLSDPNALRHPWDVLPSLRDSYSQWSRSLGHNPETLANAIDALLELLKTDDSPRDEIRPMAAELLENIANEYPRCRQEIASKLAPHVEDMTDVRPNTRNLLVHLAEVVGLGTELGRQGEAMPGDVQVPCFGSALDLQAQSLIELLDDEVLLPGMAISTLSQYCRFMIAMGAAVDPMEKLAALGLTMDQYVQCVSAWGELLSRRDDVAIRYSQLIAALNPPK